MWRRRDVVRAGLVGAGALALGGSLAACGGAGSGPVGPVEGAGTAPARPGGVLRAAFAGSGAADTLDPFASASPLEYARTELVHDTLFSRADGAPQPRLALAADPAPDGSSVTVRLRPGVGFHDGRPVRAADVAYSLRYLDSPDRAYPSELSTLFDIPALRVVDDLTVWLPTRVPVGAPAEVLSTAGALWIVPEGSASFDDVPVEAQVGAGSFRLAAHAAGQESRLTRDPGHWAGETGADEIVCLSVDDPAARVNALRAGQADIAVDIPPTIARTGAGDEDLQVRRAGDGDRIGYGFVLNVTQAPFSDPRVRAAARAAVDRQAMVDRVLLGFGVPGNDLFGAGAPYFATDVPIPPRDLDLARRLVQEAGAQGAVTTVRTADYEYGYGESTELFVAALREIGLDARVQEVPIAEFFGEGADLASATAFTIGNFPLAPVYSRSAIYPQLAFPDPELTAAVATATATTDEAVRAGAWRDAQQVMVDRGNWVVWGLADTLSLARTAVTGVRVQTSAKYPYLGAAGFA